jgi:hypothetical protein
VAVDWVKPFRAYRVTGVLEPGPDPGANVHEELVSEFDDLDGVMAFVSNAVAGDATGGVRWRIRDFEGARVSPADYELMPDGAFDVTGSQGERLAVQFRNWDIFSYWWEDVLIDVDSQGFCGKGRDYYLPRNNIFNLANQVLRITEGKSDSYDCALAVGALRFSVTAQGAKPAAVSGVLRALPNHGLQRVEFAFTSDFEQLSATVSQVRDTLAHSHSIGDVLTLDRYWERQRTGESRA